MVAKKKVAEGAPKKISEGGGGNGLFPRGGGDSLAAVERKRLRLEAQAEAARDFAEDQQSGKVVKKRREAGEDEDDLFSTRQIAKRGLPKHVDLLKFKSLSEEMKLLGIVKEVSAKELLVSLPHGLRGHVSIPEASDLLAERIQANAKAGVAPTTGLPSLTDLFAVGQFVGSTIIGLSENDGARSRKRIELSLRLRHVNTGLTKASLKPGMILTACVKSEEDHGFTMDLGVKGTTAFLPKGELKGRESLLPGSLVDVSIASTKGKVVSLRSDPEELATSVSKQWDGLTINSLRVGAMVNARVAAVMKDGLNVTFLTFFSGVIDKFHLSKSLVGDDWATKYSPGQKLMARILYVDPVEKRAGLSLAKHLLEQAPARLPKLGKVYDAAVVRRIDPSVGLLLELPGKQGAPPVAGFAHVSNISESQIKKLEKEFKQGQVVKARVIGHRPMDGVAVMTMRPDVVEQLLLSHADVSVGQMIIGTIVKVEDYGLVVQLTPSIKALCPTLHMSDSGTAYAKKKFAEGKKISARVLQCDPVAKKIVLTLKKQLLKIDSPIITSLEDAEVGKKAYGMVTGLKDYGIFVSFFGSTSGLVRTADLGLKEDEKLSECFKVGQVVRPRVVSIDESKKRILLSLQPKKDGKELGVAASSGLRPGDLVEGEVDRLDADEQGGIAVKVHLEDGRQLRGLIPHAHLSDHPVGAAAIREAISPGSSLGQMIVLELVAHGNMLLLSRKQALVRAAESLPATFEEVKESALLPGYVASVTADAVYIRFLGRVTGRAGLAQMADTFVSDARKHFSVGQTVRAQIVQVDATRGRFNVTLKSALTASADGALLASLFADLELAMKLATTEGQPVDWASDFVVGSVAEGQVHEVKDYGIVCDLDSHPDLLGLVALHQAPETLEVGHPIKGRVLDVNKQDGIVDLSLKAGLCKSPKKAAKATEKMQPGDKVDGVVELIKDEYVVVSIPKANHAIGFISAKDYNLHILDAHKRFSIGQSISATVAAAPVDANGRRLLLHMPLALTAEAQLATKKPKRLQIQPGDVVEGTVSKIYPVHASVQLGEHLPRARVHVSHILDFQAGLVPDAAESPMQNLSVGASVKGVVMGNVVSPSGNMRGLLELSMRPSDLRMAEKGGPFHGGIDPLPGDLAKGSKLVGYCHKIERDHLWIVLSPNMRGRAELLDCSTDPAELQNASITFCPGRPINVTVISSSNDDNRRQIDLAVLPKVSSDQSLEKGSVHVGIVIKVIPGRGLHVNLRGHVKGRVGITDIHDHYVPDALQGFEEGMFVKGCVLGTDADGYVDLSLRSSDSGWWPGCDEDTVTGTRELAEHPKAASSLSEGQPIKGYVKAVTPKGMFVSLSSTLVAFVKLRNLSDGFVEDPKSAFPLGHLVTGRVLRADGGSVEITLKSIKGSSRNLVADLESLEVGETVMGSVKRVEKFGVFVQLDKSAVSGLAHISEVLDGAVKNIKGSFHAGQRVRARILSIDKDAGRLSLGLKPSYFATIEVSKDVEDEGEADFDEQADVLMADEDEDNEISGEDGLREAESDDKESGSEDEDAEEEAADIDAMDEDTDQDEATASQSKPANFLIDSLDAANIDLGGWGEVVLGDETVTAGDVEADNHHDKHKKNKASKKREAREKEAEIRRAELARLEDKGAPASKKQFEQAVMASPNSSFIWIKYMAFLISLGETGAARSVAERALTTIGQREEGEKFNVWVAFINMENIYGEPPEEAVMNLLGRALQYNNQKKLYLAALSIFQRTKRTGLCDQVLKAVTRKFSSSAKVWLRAYSYHLDCDRPDVAKRTLDRAIDALPRRKHIKVLTQVGIMEFKSGDPERGRSFFENMLRNYPKRMDLWSVYLDQEIRAGDLHRCRSLFDRVTYLKLPPKKMKFLFKRYLDFEKQHGTAAEVEHVKQRAMEFVESLNNAA